MRVAKRVHRHAEAALGGAVAPVLGDLLELARARSGSSEPSSASRARYPAFSSRVTDWRTLRIGAALEREGGRVDDRLVAEVERAQPGLLEQLAARRADAERGDPQRPLLGERDDRLAAAPRRPAGSPTGSPEIISTPLSTR